MKIKLTSSQKNAVDWALGGMEVWNEDDGFREDNEIPEGYEIKMPFIEGNFLHLDDSELYFMDLMYDLEYRLCEQAYDVSITEFTANANEFIKAAQNAWDKIKKEIN